MPGTRGFTFEESFTVATAETRTLTLPTIQIPGSLHLTQCSFYNDTTANKYISLWVEKNGLRYPIVDVNGTTAARIGTTLLDCWLSGDVRLIATFPAMVVADVVRWALYGVEYLP